MNWRWEIHLIIDHRRARNSSSWAMKSVLQIVKVKLMMHGKLRRQRRLEGWLYSSQKMCIIHFSSHTDATDSWSGINSAAFVADQKMLLSRSNLNQEMFRAEIQEAASCTSMLPRVSKCNISQKVELVDSPHFPFLAFYVNFCTHGTLSIIVVVMN